MSAAEHAIVERIDPTQVEEVIALSKRYQGWLGQLPYQAFHIAAAKGHLFASYVDGELAGYALFRHRARDGVLALTHLCVDDRYRGQGVARGLIDALVASYPVANGIQAWCRESYPAHDAWLPLGFTWTGRKSGRSKEGHQLACWWLPIQNTLFTFDAGSAPMAAAAIDTNVYRDIVQERTEHPDSMALWGPNADWLADSVELVICGQTETEINAQSAEHPELRRSIRRFRQLSAPSSDWRPLFNKLATNVPSAKIQPNDLRTIAQACCGSARYFVTQDEPVIKAAEVIEDTTGIRVVRPADLLLIAHADSGESNYVPEALCETGLSFGDLPDIPSRSDLGDFVNSKAHERLPQLVAKLREASASVGRDGHLWHIADPGGIIALAAASPSSTNLKVSLLRVRGTNRSTFARQLLDRLRQLGRDLSLDSIVVTDEVTSELVPALLSEGFTVADGLWTAELVKRSVTSDEELRQTLPLLDAGLDELSAAEVSELERRYWPLRVFTGRTPCHVVPIQEPWARELFGNEPGQQVILPRRTHLGIAREHVYYKSFRSNLTVPSRLAWYVSGQSSNGGIRAFSWLEAVDSARPRTLYRRHGGLGVYGLKDVEELVTRRGGQATALRFGRTEVAASVVTYEQMKPIFDRHSQPLPFPTMREIPEQMFEELYWEGTGQ